MTNKCHLYVNHLNFARQLKLISLKKLKQWRSLGEIQTIKEVNRYNKLFPTIPGLIKNGSVRKLNRIAVLL